MQASTDYSVQVFRSPEDSGYIALTPEFPGLSAFGETPQDALREMRKVLELAIATTLEDGETLPKPLRPEPARLPSGKLLLRLPRVMHANLAERARKEGVSLNTLLLSLISAGIGVLLSPEAPVARAKPPVATGPG